MFGIRHPPAALGRIAIDPIHLAFDFLSSTIEQDYRRVAGDGWPGSNEVSPQFISRASRSNIEGHMWKLGLAKEKIAYLKLWLTIVAAVGVTLIGWFLSNFRSAHWQLVVADVLALLVIGFVGYAIHTRIEAKITRIKEL